MTSLDIGITGHRDLRPEELEGLHQRVRAFFELMKERHPQRQARLLSALAEGADTIAAMCANDLGIPLVAVLPLPLAELEQDFDSPEALETFRTLLSRAGEVVELPAKEGADLGDQDIRSWHYARMGAYISDHCEILLALWDGKDNNALGGTAQVVRYHLGSDMPGFTDSNPRKESLVCHIVASRNREGGEPRDGLEPGQQRWLQGGSNRAARD